MPFVLSLSKGGFSFGDCIDCKHEGVTRKWRSPLPFRGGVGGGALPHAQRLDGRPAPPLKGEEDAAHGTNGPWNSCAPDIRQGACKPGSVPPIPIASDAGARRQPFISAMRCRTAPATNPGDWRETRLPGFPGAPPLFGLAPGGVCRAASVAGRAVRSYRTLSPLPVPRRSGAIGGLLSVALSLAPALADGSRRALPATLVSWSPDFPRHTIRFQME